MGVLAIGLGLFSGLTLITLARQRRRQPGSATPAPAPAPELVPWPAPLPLGLPDIERLQELLGGVAVVGAALVGLLMPQEVLWPG